MKCIIIIEIDGSVFGPPTFGPNMIDYGDTVQWEFEVPLPIMTS